MTHRLRTIVCRSNSWSQLNPKHKTKLPFDHRQLHLLRLTQFDTGNSLHTFGISPTEIISSKQRKNPNNQPPKIKKNLVRMNCCETILLLNQQHAPDTIPNGLAAGWSYQNSLSGSGVCGSHSIHVLFITAVNFITASAWLLLWLPLILVWLIRMASWIDGWQDGMNGVVLLV